MQGYEPDEGQKVNHGQVITRMRREMLQHERELTRVRDALLRIAAGHDPGATAEEAWKALGCARYDEPYPPRPEIVEQIAKIAATDRNVLRRLVPVAVHAIEEEIAMAISARKSLAFMNAIAEPVPERLHNLPMPELKRALNAYAFALTRRIPGWGD